MKPGQQQHTGGAITGDHFHIKVGDGPATNRVNTTGRPRVRNQSSSSRCTPIVSRASGTSSGAPTRTKSFCMSTTMSADLSGRSGKALGVASTIVVVKVNPYQARRVGHVGRR